ncbi:TetR family transcriptional regulator [Fusobacterium ulcerans]|uniref:TetR family transcriptional regulator n=1 Tax=Fusobacterium ulcerans TaxID=861 RepID=UPI0026DCEE6B|nr:TetR family transcriptional regulator [Fusobacterium ulcerans]
MDFERVKTEEQRKIRIQQIKDAATKLFDIHDFHEITLADIAKGTNFTRGNLYKYVSSKEEIFLLVMIDEFNKLLVELKIKINRDFSKKTDEFSEILAKEIEKQDRFLKLFSILYTNLEKNASEEKLIRFKEELNYCQIKFIKIIKTAFPSLEEVQIRKFLEILSCFIIGFYPLVSPNDIQKEALKKAKIGYYPPSFKKVLREQIISTLRNVIYHSGEKVSSIPYRLI